MRSKEARADKQQNSRREPRSIPNREKGESAKEPVPAPTTTEDAVFGAAVKISDVHKAVSGVGHELHDFSDGIFVVAANHGFHQEDFGLAEQVRGTAKDVEIKAFGVNLDHVRQIHVAGRYDFVEGLHCDHFLLGT